VYGSAKIFEAIVSDYIKTLSRIGGSLSQIWLNEEYGASTVLSECRLVENGAARHTHDTPFVQIAFGSAVVCGFGLWLRICAEDPGIWLRHRAWVYRQRLALTSGMRFGFGRLVCTFERALPMQECTMVLASCSVRESWEKSREKSVSTVRPA